jgi:hypothetical protein
MNLEKGRYSVRNVFGIVVLVILIAFIIIFIWNVYVGGHLGDNLGI